MYNFADTVFSRNLRLYSWKVITYLWFKVLSVASHYFFPSFWPFADTISKRRSVFWGNQWIDPFFDFFIRAEMLMSQVVWHRAKQMVAGRNRFCNIGHVAKSTSLGFYSYRAYCVTFLICLFRPALTAAAIYRKRRKQSCTPNIIVEQLKKVI